MKEKALMTSFFAANMTDIGITTLAMKLPGFQEIGKAAPGFFEQGQDMTMYVAKLAITAGIIGLYALSHNHKKIGGIDMVYVFDRALKLGNLAVWSAVAWNILNVVPALLTKP